MPSMPKLLACTAIAVLLAACSSDADPTAENVVQPSSSIEGTAPASPTSVVQDITAGGDGTSTTDTTAGAASLPTVADGAAASTSTSSGASTSTTADDPASSTSSSPTTVTPSTAAPTTPAPTSGDEAAFCGSMLRLLAGVTAVLTKHAEQDLPTFSADLNEAAGYWADAAAVAPNDTIRGELTFYEGEFRRLATLGRTAALTDPAVINLASGFTGAEATTAYYTSNCQ